ncbi:MAG: acylglycerol kinase family protein, partial [Clostridia bacterium]|nr:acylglycerol kinase family protein [Clostridia bacterium]
MKYVLYNPNANNGQKPDYLDGVEYREVIGLNYQAFFDGLAPEDEVVLVGGDGTLNYFINAVDTNNIKNNVFLKPAGTGNDFMN